MTKLKISFDVSLVKSLKGTALRNIMNVDADPLCISFIKIYIILQFQALLQLIKAKINANGKIDVFTYGDMEVGKKVGKPIDGYDLLEIIGQELLPDINTNSYSNTYMSPRKEQIGTWIKIHDRYVLIKVIINLIDLIDTKRSTEQALINTKSPIDEEKTLLQDNMTAIRQTLGKATLETIKAISNIRPAQNYGLTQLWNIIIVVIKDKVDIMQIEMEGSAKEVTKIEILKDLDTIKKNSWTKKFLNLNAYCRKCPQLRYRNNHCKFMYNICNSKHQPNICTNKLHCKWCGQRKGEHMCQAFEQIYRIRIRCPIRKQKGHFGSECNLLFLVLSMNSIRRNINRRKRRFKIRIGQRNNKRMAFRS